MADVTTPALIPQRSGFGSALNGVGAAVVAFWFVASGAARGGSGDADLITATGLATLAIWAIRAFLPVGRIRDIAALLMVLGGSALVGPTQALLITPAIIAVSGLMSDLRLPRMAGPVAATVGAVIAYLSCLAEGRNLFYFAGVLSGYALGLVVGYSRRQAAESLARERALEREQARAALLADRATVARDIHDVLAHSLGGLVIQLDAVDALLEAGRVDEAAARVTAARTLAADGLGEARRAVATLRDPDAGADVGADPLSAPDAVEQLVAAHRGLGGTITTTGMSAAAGLDAAHRRVLAGVLREALSNARRHAPGRPVEVAVSRTAGSSGAAGEGARFLRAVIANPVAGDTAPDGGNGLPGMRSRVAELGDRSRLEAGRDGDRFIVTLDLEVA